MNEKMEEFYELLNKFYDNSIFREVYKSDDILVCNVFEQFYAVFNLDVIKETKENFFGFMMNSNGLKSVVEDSRFFNQYYEHLSEEMLNKRLIVFNENYYEKLLQNRHRFESLPPSTAIDLEYEESLKQKNR